MKERFVAFYSSRPFWAISAPSFCDLSEAVQFHNTMEDVVFKYEDVYFKFWVCRDGRLLLQIISLEESNPFLEQSLEIEVQVSWLSKYLAYINCLYLLLESCVLDIMKIAYFELTELTRRDAIRVDYENGRIQGQTIAVESYAGQYQMGTYASQYGGNPQFDIRFLQRNLVIPETVFNCTAEKISQIFPDFVLVDRLSTITKALSEYKIGNYSIALVLSWFVVESHLAQIWRAYLEQQNQVYSDGSKRINSDRMAFLTEGRDYPISVVSNSLELAGLFTFETFQRINVIRGFRNKVIHQDDDFICNAAHAKQAIELAMELLMSGHVTNIKLNYSFGVRGFKHFVLPNPALSRPRCRSGGGRREKPQLVWVDKGMGQAPLARRLTATVGWLNDFGRKG